MRCFQSSFNQGFLAPYVDPYYVGIDWYQTYMLLDGIGQNRPEGCPNLKIIT